MTKRYTITDDGVTDNLSKKQYTKIKSGDNILDTISFTSLIQIVDLLNKQDQKIKELTEDNKQYEILVESLKDKNQKLKLRLKDLGVEYY